MDKKNEILKEVSQRVINAINILLKESGVKEISEEKNLAFQTAIDVILEKAISLALAEKDKKPFKLFLCKDCEIKELREIAKKLKQEKRE